jgi:hypothetical protein
VEKGLAPHVESDILYPKATELHGLSVHRLSCLSKATHMRREKTPKIIMKVAKKTNCVHKLAVNIYVGW